MPHVVVLGLMLVVAGGSLFLGAGIGFYAATSAADRKQRKLNNSLNNL